MALGSGTKAYTATAIMRLVDAGRIKLDDPAHLHVDGPLSDASNQTMESLFGPWARNVTVRHLIFMQSGIQDYEIGSFDDALLLPNNSRRVHDPVQILRWVA